LGDYFCFNFIICYWSVWVVIILLVHKYLEICPFLQYFSIYLNIGSQSGPRWFLVFPWSLLLSLLFCFSFILIWVFSLLISVRFARGLSILFVFQRPAFCLIDCMVFLVYFINLALIFIISFLLFFLGGLACSCFARSLRCSIRSFSWDLSVFLICALMAINFSLRMVFAVSHRFW
jgi:hypothetical protein